jgi:hypothetical protein
MKTVQIDSKSAATMQVTRMAYLTALLEESSIFLKLFDIQKSTENTGITILEY